MQKCCVVVQERCVLSSGRGLCSGGGLCNVVELVQSSGGVELCSGRRFSVV